MVACASLNVMIERVAYRPLRNAPKLAPLITAVGFSFILQNVGILWRGGSQQSVDNLIRQEQSVIEFLGVAVSRGDLLAIGVTLPLVFVVTSFIARSRLGKAMRATAQDPEAARLMGINVDQTISLTFLLGGLLAGAAGLIYALYQTNVWFFQGFTAGPHRVHRGGDGRHRQPARSGARRAHHRLHPADIRQPHRRRVDARDRLRLPDLDHDLPPARPARRADEGGRMSKLAATLPAN